VPLALAHQPRRLYVENPIKLVICQIKFPLLSGFDQPGFLAPIQAALSARFPRVNQEQQHGFVLGAQGTTQIPAATIWRFSQLDGQWSVALARDVVTLEIQSYRRYEEFRACLEEILDVLLALDVRVRERLGLRYVNRLSHSQAQQVSDWKPFIRSELLGVVGGKELGDDVVQALEQIRLKEPDGHMVVHHGYLSDEAAGGEGAHYLIDIDCFDDRPVEFDRNETLALVDSYHERLKNFFEISITDEMRDHLVVAELLDA
jgi:uncharacterized protein (TIGR04255 family)